MSSALGQVVLLFAVLIVSSCTTEKEKAQEYYDVFSDIIVPYKDGTESILTQVQSMLQNQLNASGDFKLSHEDSLQQERLIAEFEALSGQTLDKLNAMEEFDDSELRSAGVRYVEETSGSVFGAYRDIALPLQDVARRPANHTIDSLSEVYSDQLVRSNENFASRQLDFMKKYGLLSL